MASSGSLGGHASIHSSNTDSARSISRIIDVLSNSLKARYPLGLWHMEPIDAIVMFAVFSTGIPLITHKARRERIQTVVRCSVMEEKPMCLMIFARQSDMPSTLSNSSPLLGRSDSSHKQMVMRNVSMAVLAIAKADRYGRGSVTTL